MKGHKLTLLLVILTIILSSFSSAAWVYDDISNSSNINWNLINMPIEGTQDYYAYTPVSGIGNMYSNQTFNYDVTGSTPYSFMWRIYHADYAQDYGYAGIGTRETTSATGYIYKLYYHSIGHLYFEFNDTTFYDWNPTAGAGSAWNTYNGIQDFLIIFYPEAPNGRIEVGYKNVSAYNDAFTKTGFANLVNVSLAATRGGSWNLRARWNPSHGGGGNATNRFYDFGTSTLPFTMKSVGARDIANNRTILDFKINYNGTIYRTTNGTLYINFENTSNTWEKYNVVVDGNSNGGYMTEQYLNYNFSLAEANSTFNVSNGDITFLVLRNSDSAIMTTYEQTINLTNMSVPAMSKKMNVSSLDRDGAGLQEVIISTNSDTYRTKKFNFSMNTNSSRSEIITLDANYCNQSAYDIFSGEVLNTFSLRIDGVVYRTTNRTTLIPKDTWTNCSQSIHSGLFDSSENSGYFTETKTGISLLGSNHSLTNDRIQIIGSNALDQSSIPFITCQVNATNITSTGGICYLNHTQSDARLSVFASGYNFTTDLFTLTGNLTYYRNLTLSKVMNFVIYREFDQSCFPFTTNDNVSMVVYCAGASQQFNITSCNQNLTIGCSFDSILLSHTNGTFAYFRSLIPSYNDTLVNWYMLDLNKDVGVQVIINLLDYSGQYDSGVIRLKRFFGSTQFEIIEQNFDIEDSVDLYLLKHARYSVEICNYAGSCVSLGEIIGDVAEEKTLTIPNIGFYPTDSLLGNQITWQMNWTPNNRIYFNYNDTSHGTSMIEWLVYNGRNTSQLYYNNTIMTYDLYTSYIIPAAYYNSTFIACFVAYTPALTEPIRDCSAFYDIGKPFGYWEGFTTQEINKTKFWGALIFLFVIMFLFSPLSINTGLVTTNVFLFIFIKFNWLITGNPVKDYAILIICAALSGYYIIGTATKSGGTSA